MKHHTEMHGLQVGDFVYEVGGCIANQNTPISKRVTYKIVDIFGFYKDDYIRIIENEKLNKVSPCLFARGFSKA